jgi:hypothetical protein
MVSLKHRPCVIWYFELLKNRPLFNIPYGILTPGSNSHLSTFMYFEPHHGKLVLIVLHVTGLAHHICLPVLSQNL